MGPVDLKAADMRAMRAKFGLSLSNRSVIFGVWPQRAGGPLDRGDHYPSSLVERGTGDIPRTGKDMGKDANLTKKDNL